MSDFSSKKYYGFSMHNDPELLTTTKNFEFRYARADNLERAIQKVKVTDAAEAKQKKAMLLNKFCKLKKITDKIESKPFKSLVDFDIETQMSTHVVSKVRPMTDTEIDQLIGHVKSSMVIKDEQMTMKAMKTTTTKMTTTTLTHALMEEEADDEMEEDTSDNVAKTTSKPATTTRATTMNSIVVEEYRTPQPKWVELEVKASCSNLTITELKQPQQQLLTSTTTVQRLQPAAFKQQLMLNQLHEQAQQFAPLLQQQPQQYTHPIYSQNSKPHYDQQQPQLRAQPPLLQPLPQPLMQQSENAGTLELLNNYEDMLPHNYYVEDSDYEYEMLGRAEYTQYCGPRPAEDELTNLSNESGGVPQFIEVEPQLPCMNLSFLKNATPLRYTDMTDEAMTDERVENPPMKIFIKPHKTNDPVYDAKSTEHNSSNRTSQTKQVVKKKQTTKKETKKIPTTSDKLDLPSVQNIKFPKYLQQQSSTPCPSKVTKSTGSPKSPKSPRSPRKTEQYGQKTSSSSGSSNNSSRRDRSKSKMRNVVESKSLEELKIEKIALFSKMNTLQERIIEMLQSLRISLLEIYIPDSNFDKSRRQKNAFEFSVRFSRNFLYPLKGMIDDINNTTMEQFNSCSSNDACSRIASIYVLILQSLETYQKQVRYFMFDQVHQKLTALIELTTGATSACLNKGIFDRNDPIIEILQEHCAQFLKFLQELHEDRFQATRDHYRKFNIDKHKAKNSHAKYDLKMFMNDLNMYEPKLVPKKVRAVSKPAPSTSSPTTTSKKPSTLKTRRDDDDLENSSNLVINKELDDKISTQIQTVEQGASSELPSSQNLTSADKLGPPTKVQSDNNHPLNKAVIEALQLVTKEQVRQVLNPILQTLGNALDKKNNSETIETILKAFNRKIFSTREENKKQCDAGNNRKRGKVSGEKVVDDYESSLQSATTASKAAKQTKARAESQQHETATSNSSSRHNNYNNNKNNSASRRGSSSKVKRSSKNKYRERNEVGDVDDVVVAAHNHDDDDDDEEAAVDADEYQTANNEETEDDDDDVVTAADDNSDDSDDSNDDDFIHADSYDDDNNQIAVVINKKKKQPQLQSQSQPLKEPPPPPPTPLTKQQLWQQEQALLHRQQLHEQQLQQQQQLLHQKQLQHQQRQQLLREQLEQQQMPLQQQHNEQPAPPPLQLHYPLQQQQHLQLHSQQHLRQQHTSRKQLRQQELQKLQQPPLQVCKTTRSTQRLGAASSLAVFVPPTSASSTHFHDDTSRPSLSQRNIPAACHKNKGRLFRKRRNPLLPPPPAPAGTPLTSARKPITAEALAGDADAEELPHAMTNRNNNNNEYYTNSVQNAANITSQHLDTVEDISEVSSIADVPTLATTTQCTPAAEEATTASAAAAIAAALDVVNIGDNANALNLLQSRAIADMLAKCLVNAHENNGVANEREAGTPHTHATSTSTLQQHELTTAAATESEYNVNVEDDGDDDEDIEVNNDAALEELEQLENEYASSYMATQQARANYEAQINAMYAAEGNTINQQQQEPQEHLERQPQQHLQQPQSRHPNERRPPLNEINRTPFANNKENLSNLTDNNNNMRHNRSGQNRSSKCDLRVDHLLQQRDNFLNMCGKNRFYNNPNYAEPWKVFSRLSDKLATEIVNSVETDFSVGVSKFVDDFLEAETQT